MHGLKGIPLGCRTSTMISMLITFRVLKMSPPQSASLEIPIWSCSPEPELSSVKHFVFFTWRHFSVMIKYYQDGSDFVSFYENTILISLKYKFLIFCNCFFFNRWIIFRCFYDRRPEKIHCSNEKGLN